MKAALIALVTCSGLLAGCSAIDPSPSAPDVSHDGLVRVESREVSQMYVRPGAVFTEYTGLLLLDTEVAFRSHWQSDHNRFGIRVTSNDMERIKRDLAEEFRRIFTEELAESDNFEMVSEPGENVLVLRPAIVDLDITAPDVLSAGRVRTYATNAGEMTLYLELYDGSSGQILARAVDRERARDSMRIEWYDAITNRMEARIILQKWARLAREHLDSAVGVSSSN